MPAGNQTGHDTDYCIGHPPPPTAYLIAVTSLALAAVGAVAEAYAGMAGSRKGMLLALGFTLVSLAVAFWAVTQLRNEGRAAGVGTGTATRLAALSPASALATAACPAPSEGVRYHLGPMQASSCPETWPLGTTVVFFEHGSDLPLAEIVVPAAKCTLTLRSSLVKNQHGQNLEIAVS